MARHSKNATSAPFYSYHERKKIRGQTRVENFGSSCSSYMEHRVAQLRLPQFRRFQMSRNEGLIFCKECLFLNFESQKKKIQKETKAWEALQAQKEQEAAAAAEANATAAQRAFLEAEASLTLETSAAPAQTKNSPQSAEEFRQTLEQPTINSKEEARAKNFWVPENTPDEPEAKLKEPQKGFCCPITGAPLRIKQLITVKPVLASKEDTENTRWLCALSGREISHQKAAVVKSTGQVILLEYLEKLVFGKKGALTSGVIDRKDTVALIPGGTGFSAHNNVEVAVARPNVQ